MRSTSFALRTLGCLAPYIESSLARGFTDCTRRLLLSWILFLTAGWTCQAICAERPNVLVLFTDDQGYGDLGCFGSTTIRTPRLDSLAIDGTKFTSFYAQVVCGPSRSALLTARYPSRSLGWSMPANEVTLPEILHDEGYISACIGKWDVSNRQPILDRMPLAQGFDYFYGTLGANDNGKVVLYENDQKLLETSDMASLTRQYTDKAIEFLRQRRDNENPFFLYVAHTMAHSIIDASAEFKGKSKGGLFGDVIEELDYHSGRLLDVVDELGLRENTLVIFTTDNGPWNNMQERLLKNHNGQIAWGSSGPLRDGKGTTYEGGIRVPCLMRWPGHIPAGRSCDAILATIDLMPTLAKLTGATLPSDRFIDGVDQTQLLIGKSDVGNRDNYFYFCQNELQAVRKGKYKLLLADRRRQYPYVQNPPRDLELYDLEADIGERNNLAETLPEIVAELKLLATSVPLPDPHYESDLLSQVQAAPKNERNALTVVEWQSHGRNEAQRDAIRKAFQQGIDGGVIPGGSMMIIEKDEVVFREAFGVKDLETGEPFTVDAPCRIASLTKPHTATLLSILQAQGIIDLDQGVATYLPELAELTVGTDRKVSRSPTIRECLSHTAGFIGNTARRNSMSGLQQAKTLGEAVHLIARQSLVADPGSKYEYSGNGYMVAGRVAEVVTGRSFQDLMRRHISSPLGMRTATFVPLDPVLSQLPTPYDRVNQTLVARTRDDAPSIVNPGGGLVSTLDDIAKFMLLHRNKGRVANVQIVSPETIDAMYVKQPATNGNGYGLGFNILAERADGTASRVQHTGASGTLAMIDFDLDLIVIVLTQVDQQKIGGWRSQLLKTAFQALSR